ncbi:cellulose synthase operon protein c [Anaeramoeba flamelloides]|uniref:Cellulose synthase operon protein c n=1 Tax=Anaeramoeba flamelloides TaxID=1746091 RepID=A0AAV7ZY91_9EUKA|nr:cellulose synthase operon protein c [Anaeramoeba flamelloides]
MKSSLEISQDLTRQGELFYENMKYGEAKQALEKSIVINPLNTASYYLLGMLHTEQGNFEESEKILLRSLQREPRNVKTINSLVMLLVFMCKKDSLCKYLKRLIEIEPYDPSPYLKIIGVLVFLERPNEAFEMANKLLEFDPTNFIAHCNQGVIHLKRGHLEKALKSFGFAVDYSTNYCLAWLHLSALQFHLGKVEEANNSLLEVFETVSLVEQKDFYFNHLSLKFDEKDKFVRYWNSELFFNPSLELNLLGDFKSLNSRLNKDTFKNLTEKFLYQPQDAEWFYEMGKTALSRGWFNLSLDYLSKVKGKKASRSEFRVDLEKTSQFFIDAINKNTNPLERKRQALNILNKQPQGKNKKQKKTSIINGLNEHNNF